MTSNLETALALAARGVAVFPCRGEAEDGPGSKQPIRGLQWRSASTTDERQIRKWWASNPGAAPGIDLAKSGLFVVDADRHPGKPDGVAAWEALAAGRADDAPQLTTGGGGRHIYFRQGPQAFGNVQGSFPDCINTRGAGGYVLAPDAILSEGRSYGSADIFAAYQIPPWLYDVISGKKAAAVEAPKVVAAQQLTDARVSAYLKTALDAIIGDLRSTAKGGRNIALNNAAMRLGHFVAAGWMTRGEAEAMLIEAADANGHTGAKGNSIRSTMATINSGMAKGLTEPATIPDDSSQPSPEALATAARITNASRREMADPDTGELVDQSSTPAAGQMPDCIVPPGLVGDICRWITETARHPQPILSLGAALTVVGTAIGRRWAGPTLSGTHLYVVGLAPSGAGKDHVLKQSQRLLRACGMKGHVGPSEFISMPAVINLLWRMPLSLCAMDEFGAFLKRINGKRASPFEAAISKILRTAWGSSFSNMTTPEWAGKEAKDILSPAMSIFGASTPEEFYGSLEGADQDNGVLNRFLILAAPSRPAERDPKLPPLEVPPAIIDNLTRLYNGSVGNIPGGVNRSDQVNEPKVHQLAWGAEPAKDLYEAFAHEVEQRSDNNVLERSFLARTVEMALRIATIIAAGRGSSTVDASDIEAGRDLSMWSSETMIRGARDYISDNDNQAQAQLIVRIVRGHGGRLAHQGLLHALRHRMKARDLKDLITSMIESGTLLFSEEATGGRPKLTYFLTA